MPTLLQINSVANIGSTGRIAEQIGNKAIEKGWKSFIAYGRDAAASISSLIRIGNKSDIYTHLLGSRIFDRHGLLSKRATRLFLNEVERVSPDVIHIHNLHGYYINYPLLLDFIHKNAIPTVITMHDFWLMTGHCAYIDDVCTKWKSDCNKCPRLKSYPKSVFDNASSNLAIKKNLFEESKNLTLVPVSYWLQKKVNQSIFKNVPSRVIQNGIDISLFYPDKSEILFNDDKIRLLCVATRWTDSNGFPDILKLAKTVKNDVEIIVVGVDKQQKTQLPENVVGIERTEDVSRLRQLYSQANLFINPNKEVTFGLVTAESMACGTPSVVFKDTAGEEIVNDLGYVINDIFDVNDIIDSIRQRSMNIQIGCVNHIRENFDANVQLDKYFQLYSEII